MTNIMQNDCKTGVVALIGPANAGKSTLLNRLLGQKISIVSPKPQTTRNRIAGIVNGPDHQIVILDTPGIHKAKSRLHHEMMKIAAGCLAEVDAVLFMLDATAPPPGKDDHLARWLSDCAKPVILLLNKIDLLAKEKLLPLIAATGELHPFTAILPISAKTGEGTELVIRELCSLLPAGPRIYPDDIPTDLSERFIVGEMIREKIFLKTGQEIPYATAVVVESFQENPAKGLTTIHAMILVERESQKGIIIGRQGAKLKEIGQAAREDIEELLDQKVLLKLWVKVEKNWSESPRMLRELGFS